MPAQNSKKPIIRDKFKLKKNLEGNKKFVAFLDVMGFSELVYRTDSAEALDSYFSKITDEIESIRAEPLGKKLQSFLISDSIILIAPDGLMGLKLIIDTVKRIQSALIWRKVLLRGAISFGEVFYEPNHNIIVGKAFIKAYKLEKQANFPRVIIDPSIISIIAKDKAGFLKSINTAAEGRRIYIPSVFSKITEDGIFIDYATKTVKQNELNRNISIIYEVIKENLYSDQSLFQKYIWLRDYFLEALKYTSQEIPIAADPPQPYKKILDDWIAKFERL